MIITCPCQKKQFKIDRSLIPNEGRELQCGSCERVWFYKPQNESENSYIISHYQFFSTFLNKPFFILNRWYIWDNNSHPTENHKYFAYYKNFVRKNLNKHEIKNIYLINETEEIKFKNIQNKAKKQNSS